MPLPTPREGESQSKFISRCIASEVMQREYDKNDKRKAICYDQWDSSKNEGKD